MKIVNRINNNVVLVHDGVQLMIVTGKGIGFKVYPDDDADESLIEQRYIMQEKDVAQYISILKEIPKEFIDAAKEVLVIGEEKLKRTLPVNLVFALADHFFFTYQRVIKGQMVAHPLKWEIQQLYPIELEIGRAAVDIVNQIIPVTIPEEEDVFVAMHFINYSYEDNVSYNPVEVMELLNQSIKILEATFDYNFDKYSPIFSRFIVHLRFFIIRMLRFELDDNKNEDLAKTVKKMYPDAYQCAEKIAEHMQTAQNKNAIESEKVYLALHINRLIEDKRGKKDDK
ncbi:PRD domain-containing protein [Enterococcus saccharolyticus]|uniref:PRD domain-containing protein n=1 Tax=Enterococcus saccharolyticus TaxID=41997 RepID=UPI001E4BF778|nr:PRD domain-containing protein [Enterococcus saccharolyticus]MCD5002367.1 PRD domain-containing protein [Enterococcus saccharolyticus]